MKDMKYMPYLTRFPDDILPNGWGPREQEEMPCNALKSLNEQHHLMSSHISFCTLALCTVDQSRLLSQLSWLV